MCIHVPTSRHVYVWPWGVGLHVNDAEACVTRQDTLWFHYHWLGDRECVPNVYECDTDSKRIRVMAAKECVCVPGCVWWQNISQAALHTTALTTEVNGTMSLCGLKGERAPRCHLCHSDISLDQTWRKEVAQSKLSTLICHFPSRAWR